MSPTSNGLEGENQELVSPLVVKVFCLQKGKIPAKQILL